MPHVCLKDGVEVRLIKLDPPLWFCPRCRIISRTAKAVGWSQPILSHCQAVKRSEADRLAHRKPGRGRPAGTKQDILDYPPTPEQFRND